jgi:hypothetical protein
MRYTPPLPVIDTTVDLPSLENYTLVSLDTEGWIDNAIKIGIATCNTVVPVSPHTGPSFAQYNSINCSSVRLRDVSKCGLRNRERVRFGNKASTVDSDPAAPLAVLLGEVPQPRILVVYYGVTELVWMKKNCPSLLTAFDACIDVQGLAGEVSVNIKKPHLRFTMGALSFDEGLEPLQKNKRHHRAVNDAVYTLAVLAALLDCPKNAPVLAIASAQRRLWLFHGRPKPVYRFPYTALIRTLDRTPLPPELDTAGKIYNYLAHFSPRTAGTGKTHKIPRSKEQLSWSWISFTTLEDLEYFLETVAHSTFPGGKRIFVESQYIPGVTLSRRERTAEQIENSDRIREERRQARLNAALTEVRTMNPHQNQRFSRSNSIQELSLFDDSP